MRHIVALSLVVVALSAHASILNRPYLQAVTQNSIWVLVECTTAETVSVDYGFTTSYGNIARTVLIDPTTSSPTTYVHKVRLAGLISDTVYHYRAMQSGNVSPDSWFRTAKPGNHSIHFAWMADSRTNSTVYDAIANLVLNRQPEFFVEGGDVCIDGTYSAWQTQFFRPNGLALISHVPFFFAVGNHEGWATNAIAFTHAPTSASNSQDYYSFDYGDVHVLVIDTEGSYSPGSAQYMFAQNDLATTTQTWKIVACHKPAYSSGGHGEDAGMKTMTTNIFEPSGVDLVVAGHNHYYQHNLVHNIHHLVVGTSGAPQYVPSNASYTIKSIQDYCYAIFDATPATLRITVYNSTDALLDTLQLSKPPTVVYEEMGGVTEFQLRQNYPNPFNPTTTIEFVLPKEEFVVVTILDLLGREVDKVFAGKSQRGRNVVRWDAPGRATGVYLVRLETAGFTQTKKLLLLR